MASCIRYERLVSCLVGLIGSVICDLSGRSLGAETRVSQAEGDDSVRGAVLVGRMSPSPS